MNKFSLLLAVALSGSTPASAKDYVLSSFKKIQLSDKFWCEGASFGDFNHDGKMDIVSGPYWWEGPDYQKRHEYYPASQTFILKKADGAEETIEGFEGALGANNAYSDNFFAFTYDFNKDGWDDVLVYGFPGRDAWWNENPKGDANGSGHWTRHKVFDVVDNESPTWGDITGDGKPEIICNSGGTFGYASPDWSDPTKPWTWTAVTPTGGWQKFTHGLGFGDVNGDGKADLLEAKAWWEQTPSGEWTKHPMNFADGGAQMYAYDVNGDGLNDVITSIQAHGYGLSWFEQQKDGTFKEHVIVGSKEEDNKYGVKFSQLHAVDLVDMDGDGLKDIVTGKRYWAHGAHGDVDPNGAAVVYWFKLVRNADKSVDWLPYPIDNDSGVGTQVVAADVNGDKLPDIIVGNKKGTFVHIHGVKNVSEEEWEKAQPKVPVAK